MACQRQFQFSGKRIHPVENGEVGVIKISLIDGTTNSQCNLVGFLSFISKAEQFNGRSLFIFREQRFCLCVSGYVKSSCQPLAGFLLCCEKFLFQPNRFAVWKIPFELQDVFNFRAAPTVNRLIRIARHTQVACVE